MLQCPPIQLYTGPNSKEIVLERKQKKDLSKDLLQPIKVL